MTFAQFVGSGTTGVIGLLNTVVVPIIFAFAFAAFIWGVYKYFILGADSETERAAGRQFVLWGIIGIVLLFSVWGFVNLLLSTLGFAPGA
ncbi:MAG: hypothetical protein ACYC1Y_00805 [Minisyncoccota bacterium]